MSDIKEIIARANGIVERLTGHGHSPIEKAEIISVVQAIIAVELQRFARATQQPGATGNVQWRPDGRADVTYKPPTDQAISDAELQRLARAPQQPGSPAQWRSDSTVESSYVVPTNEAQ